MEKQPDFPSKPPPASGSQAVDAEHGIQLGLLDAALSALSGATPDSSELLDQLHEYTQAHFMSEQLLMRLSSRPSYDGHLEDHERLMHELDEAKACHARGDFGSAAAQLRAHEEHLLRHIQSWDRSIDGPES